MRGALVLTLLLCSTTLLVPALPLATPRPSPPTLPPACNLTDSGDTPLELVAAEASFEDKNHGCYARFRLCLSEGNSTPNCKERCDNGEEALGASCAAAGLDLCVIGGMHALPGADLPAYKVSTYACVPQSCGDSSRIWLTEFWRGRLCGDEWWASGDCSSIHLSCMSVQDPEGNLWIVVGSTTAVGGALLACAAAAFCRHRAQLDLEEDEEYFAELGEGESEGAIGGEAGGEWEYGGAVMSGGAGREGGE